ncbi:PREDICTED: uncharacterized protein LOC107190790 [Dufourea novaeangliae]|uniref:uncharacterized protein LOC107190790 n=1 Tax=Dufourea novaeangliae TaxID=178035 RepID=UPI000767656F|nr:PREDICTED: uncharacterized protein LOC107190790 [Dufourea novaeangliae]
MRQSWSEASMTSALEAVEQGLPYKTASKQFSIPVMTLKRRAKGKNIHAIGSIKLLGSKRTVFTQEQEHELVQHIQDMESRMYGLTTRDILSLAYQLAEKNKIKHPFSTEKGIAGIDWLRGFRKRNPNISLRTPESTSAARARAFNKPVVDTFFLTLKNIQEEHSFPSHRIFNVDETSLSTVPTKNTKVFAKTGRKQVARVTSSERGDTTTAVLCMSASGNFIPPMLIFRRVRMKTELMDGAPPGSAYACNASGWMKLEVFAQWFEHFLTHAKPSAEDPALLILDGHLSHTKNLGVILKARQHNATILCLPPHCTHKLQPLDVGVMYPLSVYHNQALEKRMNNNPGRVVTVFQISKIFSESYLKAAVPLNAINGFSKCGIFPYNPDVFSNVDFIAAETTEQSMESDTSKPTPYIGSVSNTIQPPALPIAFHSFPQDTIMQLSRQATPSPTYAEQNNSPSLSIITTSPSTITMHNPMSPIPSTSFANFTPSNIQPMPRISGKRSHSRRVRGNASILTSTPYKNQLEEERKKKTNLERKRALRQEKKAKISTISQKGKGKGRKKGINQKRNSKENRHQISESSSDEDDTECLFCNEKYSRDKGGEGWIRCCVCLKWGHDDCVGIDNNNDADDFTCDFCLQDRFAGARKTLRL